MIEFYYTVRTHQLRKLQEKKEKFAKKMYGTQKYFKHTTMSRSDLAL